MSEIVEIRARPSQVLAARWKPSVAAAVRPELAVERHLVIAHKPQRQSLADWTKIARHVSDIDPRIAVFVVDGRNSNSYTRRRAATLPTLLCSPGPLTAFRLLRGKVCSGRRIPKYEQMRLLAAARVPVPRTEILTPQLKLDPEDWGPRVAVKRAGAASSTRGTLQLFRTDRALASLAGDPSRPLLIQKFIDTGPKASMFRVVTLFGEPLYALAFRNREPRDDLDVPEEGLVTASVVATPTNTSEIAVVVDKQILELARAADTALPDVPLKACDIVRETGTGRLYVLDLNPEGGAWDQPLADHPAGGQTPLLRELVRQFDPARAAARALVQRTNAEAI